MKNFILLLIIFSALGFARNGRQFLIPSSKFNCQTCHVNSFGGYPLTLFGQDVNSNLDGNNINWAALSQLDSDGDGATNGAELGDPDGTWMPGDDQSDPSIVTDPNDPADFPTSVDAKKIFGKLKVGPNPSFNSINIDFYLKRPDFTDIEIYNSNGELIDQLDFRFRNIGLNTFSTSHSLVPGNYFIVLKQKDIIITKMIVIQ